MVLLMIAASANLTQRPMTLNGIARNTRTLKKPILKVSQPIIIAMCGGVENEKKN